MQLGIIGRLPTVPEYFMEYIRPGVDLTQFPKQCCPFHSEEKPSFSYNIESGRWSCFGRCHAHGDVVEMHKRWFKFNTREDALSDLESRYEVPRENKLQKVLKETKLIYVNEENVHLNQIYAMACRLANTPERWIELDYVMSRYPIEVYELERLVYNWEVQ